MGRPFAEKRLVGPIFTRGEYSESVNIDTKKRRLERAGALDVSSETKLSVPVIDWKMITDDPNKVFSSSIEYNRDREMRFVEIRLPNMTVEPDNVPQGTTSRKARRDEVLQLWQRLSADVGEVISDNTDIRVVDGVPQREDVEIRTQDGFYTSDKGQNLNPHIQFAPYGGAVDDLTAPVNFDEVVEIVRGLDDMWKKNYFDVKLVDRAQFSDPS